MGPKRECCIKKIILQHFMSFAGMLKINRIRFIILLSFLGGMPYGLGGILFDGSGSSFNWQQMRFNSRNANFHYDKIKVESGFFNWSFSAKKDTWTRVLYHGGKCNGPFRKMQVKVRNTGAVPVTLSMILVDHAKTEWLIGRLPNIQSSSKWQHWELDWGNLEYAASSPQKRPFVQFPLFSLKLVASNLKKNISYQIQIKEISTSGDMKVTEFPPVNTSDVKAEVLKHKGVPTLCINDKFHSGMSYMMYTPDYERYKHMADCGVDLLSFCTAAGDGYRVLTRSVHKADGTYDYSELERRVAMVLKANPKARIFLRVELNAPLWWLDKYPDDNVQYQDDNGKNHRYIFCDVAPVPSWASKQWRKDTAKDLQNLVNHIQQSPYAGAVIGYQLASGAGGEWQMWGAREKQFCDYSPANQHGFQDWLKEKYKTKVALQKAWNNSEVNFKNASIPSMRERSASEPTSLRSIQQEQNVLDFEVYNSLCAAKTLGYFASVIKKATDRKKIVGTFYGYALQHSGMKRFHNGGHWALSKVLNNPDIDYICSPSGYSFRNGIKRFGGKGTPFCMSLSGSIKLHGKLYFDENDIPTSQSASKVGVWGKASDIAGDIVQQKRELAFVCANGFAHWWFACGFNPYEHLSKLIVQLQKTAEESMTYDRSTVDETAFVPDLMSFRYIRPGFVGKKQILDQLPQLSRCGAAVGYYDISDLDRLVKYKLIILPSSFAPNDHQCAALENLKSNKRIIIFFHGAGIFRHNQFVPEEAGKFTGIDLKKQKSATGKFKFNDNGGILTSGLAGKSFGSDKYRIAPAFIPNDHNMLVIAHFSDGTPAIAIKKYNHWTAIYCAQVQLPTKFYQNAAKMAGIHLYNQTGTLLWASKDIIGMTVSQAGKQQITLPREAQIRELYSGKIISNQPVSQFVYEFTDNESAIFALESKNRENSVTVHADTNLLLQKQWKWRGNQPNSPGSAVKTTNGILIKNEQSEPYTFYNAIYLPVTPGMRYQIIIPVEPSLFRDVAAYVNFKGVKKNVWAKYESGIYSCEFTVPQNASGIRIHTILKKRGSMLLKQIILKKIK